MVLRRGRRISGRFRGGRVCGARRRRVESRGCGRGRSRCWLEFERTRSNFVWVVGRCQTVTGKRSTVDTFGLRGYGTTEGVSSRSAFLRRAGVERKNKDNAEAQRTLRYAESWVERFYVLGNWI